MRNTRYFKYIRLIADRRSKDSLYLMYKSFLDIFLENDRNKIIGFLLKSAKGLIVVPILFLLVLYTIIGSLYSTNIVEGILFSGVINIIHTILLIHSKYGDSQIGFLKKDFEFVLRLLPKRKEHVYIIQKLSHELLHSTFVYSSFTYLLSVVLLFTFVNQSIWVICIGILFVLLNYLLGLTFLIIKITRLYDRMVKGSLVVILTALITTLLNSLNIRELFPFDATALSNYFLNRGNPVIGIKVIILISLSVGGVTSSFFFIFYILKTKKVTPAVIVLKEDGFHKLFNKKDVYQRLLLRGFDSKKKLSYIRAGSLLATSTIVLLYPFFIQNDKMPLTLTILLFCYSPAIFNLLITYYLYDELLQKNFTRTTYYLLKKFQCKKYFYKYTIVTTFSQLFILLLPFLTVLLLYKPLNIFLAFVSYLLVFIIVVAILVTRIFNVGKFSYEEIKMIEAPVLTSKSTENFIVFGIPIFYAIPVVSLTLAQSELLYAYISTLIYICVLLLFCIAKIYFSLSKEGNNAASM
ncbi:hypothetical protein CU633_21155 [Bacillus sp. V3-13]|uniref:hypothetical protein n=1 Tax=Bacillus sp. V3-13 TaxID=2053728 RepID=UPI000C77FF80|nr:hypothetical protein [Bacillus sp. V3-13]PLR75429.1 hypothetical protein CU633_21155 [Bacillus sp. V3-13]